MAREGQPLPMVFAMTSKAGLRQQEVGEEGDRLRLSEQKAGVIRRDTA
jgi:hypothetical protein